jgi:serine/threonine-protein kinase
MATVFSAVQEGPHGFENEVAIKLVHPHLLREHPNVVRMVVDEARVASRIRHPNVVRIMDLCEEPPDVLYIVMDYVDGVSMRQVLDTARALRTPPPLAPVLEVLAGACDGLHAAHKSRQPDGTLLNLVHRDIKPGNILVSSDGDVKVSDFGIAFFGDRLVEATGHGQMKGTPAYMSPEQVLGTPVDARSDIFSMGLTLYTMCTAKLAFAGESPMGMAMKIAQESLEPHADELDELCFGLGDVLRTACAREPMARFPQAAAMASALREVRDTLRGKATVGEMVVGAGWRPRRPEERPGEMSSIDGKGTIVDVGPIARNTPSVTPSPPSTPSITAPFPEPDTVGDELGPEEDTDGFAERPLPSFDGPTVTEAEVLPPDPYARPVETGRVPRLRPERTGGRPGVFGAAPSGVPGAPPPSGGAALPPGAPPAHPPRRRRSRAGAVPGPPPRPEGSRPGRVLERDYRGRVVRKKPVSEATETAVLVEKVGVAVVFALILIALVVIVTREVTGPSNVEVAVSEGDADLQPPRASSDFAARAQDSLPPEPPVLPAVEGSVEPEPAPTPQPRPAVASPPRAVGESPRSTATPSATPAEPPAAPGEGLLTVNSYPWAEVRLDGRRIGTTPIIDRVVEAGPHSIRLVFSIPGPDGAVPEPVEKQIVIEGGEHEKVVHRVPR